MADSKIRVCRDDDMKVKIGDICTLKSGTSLKEDVLNESNGIPYIKVSDMNLVGNEKYIVRANSYADESINEKMLFPKGTVLFPKRGGAIGTNKKRIASKTVCADLNTMGVIPSDKISPLYLYYFFQNIDFATLYNGSSVPQINNTDIAPMEINLISLEEQDNIVTLLEKIDDIVRKRKKELSALDNLIKARFVEMFGNILCDSNLPVIQLKKLADIGSSKRIYANEYVESGVPFYRSKEIRELGTGMKPSVELFIKQERYDEIKEKYGVPKVGDILIAAIGATIGYSWIVDSENPFYYKDGNIIILSIKDNVNPIFLNHTMRILIDDFKNKGVAGSAQLALTIEKLEKMMVINPPIELQNRFADFVRAIDKSKVKVQKALDETQKLFDSLMQQYFG